MRERLTLAFVAVTLLLLLGAAFLWTNEVSDRLVADETTAAESEARAIAFIVAERAATEPLTDDDVRRLVSDDERVELDVDGTRLDVAGADFDPDSNEHVTATVVTDSGQVTVTHDRSDVLGSPLGPGWTRLLATLLVIGVLAGIAGFAVAQVLSAPFRQLATAAGALGRGRFDVEMPRTRVPEALAIGRALDSSATLLRDRLERERELALHTSHVLRTPLQSLRLQLEDLLGDPDLSEEARDAALGSLKAVGRLTQVAGELVELTRGGDLVAGAAIPLRDLATQVSQRWADQLADADPGRLLTAAVEGDIELPFTPGPVEQALDLVLADVRDREHGGVRLLFEGAASWLRVDVMRTVDVDLAPGGLSAPENPPSDEAHDTLVALGGRLEVLRDGSAWRVHLPRR